MLLNGCKCGLLNCMNDDNIKNNKAHKNLKRNKPLTSMNRFKKRIGLIEKKSDKSLMPTRNGFRSSNFK